MVQSYGLHAEARAGGGRMDQDTLQRLAAEIANHLPSYPLWQLLLIQAGITSLLAALAAGAGAFFGEYLRTRGRNLRIRAPGFQGDDLLGEQWHPAVRSQA